MRRQLRVDTVRGGTLEEWVLEWRRQVPPLRRSFGFVVRRGPG